MVDQLVWEDTTGTQTILSDPAEGITVAPGRTGFGMPPVELATDTTPGIPGATLREVIVQPRLMSVPLNIVGEDPGDRRFRFRQLISRMNPALGDGRLVVTAADGLSRRIGARYVDGLQGSFARDAVAGRLQRAMVVLEALQPFWEDNEATVLEWHGVDPTTWFPLFPLRLSASTVLAAPTVDNDGDAPFWPRWEVTGPGTSLEWHNDTTGKSFAFDPNLAGGDRMIVDTDTKTVTVNGVNRFGSIRAGSSLWPLQPGGNQLRLVVTGSTAQTTVTMTYRRRWLSV
jgi:hypothetical protein